jgi:COMPASS component SWD3
MYALVTKNPNKKSSRFTDPYVFYYGTSRNVLGMIDVRSATSMHPEKNDVQTYPISADIQLMNDAMMNTLYVSRDGVHVITGDSRGAVKVWDVRARMFNVFFTI